MIQGFFMCSASSESISPNLEVFRKDIVHHLFGKRVVWMLLNGQMLDYEVDFVPLSQLQCDCLNVLRFAKKDQVLVFQDFECFGK